MEYGIGLKCRDVGCMMAEFLYVQHVRIAQCPLAALVLQLRCGGDLEKRKSASLPLRPLLAVFIATIAR